MIKRIIIAMGFLCLLQIFFVTNAYAPPPPLKVKESDDSVSKRPIHEIILDSSSMNLTISGTSATVSSTGSGAPTDADYLVGTTNANLSAEIVVGTTPGGQLGGTWASPTIDDLFLKHDGDTATGVHDFGGATSFELPNTAGDVTCDALGEIAVDTTQKQVAVYDGAEKAIPLVHTLQATWDLAGMWDVEDEWRILELKSDTFPDGIVIINWYLDCDAADPTTEFAGDLMRCDALADGAFPNATNTVIDVLDTTTGNSNETNNTNMDSNGVVASGQLLYLHMDSDPTDANTTWMFTMHFYIPES